MIVSAGSSGLAERRWFQKAPGLAAQGISQRFADIASNTSFRFDSGFGRTDVPNALRPSKADIELDFKDFTILFDVTSWGLLTDATPSAESQILSAILALGSLSALDASSVRQRCNKLSIPVVSVKVDDAPEPKPLVDFHPRAKEILANEIFWNSTDEYTPVGNDTGADVLGLYRQWRVDNPASDRSQFFANILSQWELVPLHGIPTNDLAERLNQSHYEILTWDDTVIAWAVSQIACDGNLDARIAELADIAIKRQSQDSVISFRGWTSATERLSVLNVVRETLKAARTADGDRSGE